MPTVATAKGRPFLGQGLAFPIRVTPRGRLALVREEQRIEELIYLILSTAKGERMMLPDFGCGIHDLVFEPNNAGTIARVNDEVRRALVAFEPRVDVLEVNASHADEQPNLLLIRVSYRVRENNARGSFVYPFFVTEGT